MDPSSSSTSSSSSTWQTEAAEPSSLKTPRMEQSEFASVSTPTTFSSNNTPSQQAFPRRLSLLQTDSPRNGTDEAPRKGPKPLNLGSQSVISGAGPSFSSAVETPRSAKRSSISYISSPATSTKADEVSLSRAASNASSSSRTRTGSITASRRKASASQSSIVASDADDWLEDDSFTSTATRSMAERDSAKVEALFNDTGYREGITAGKLSTLQSGFDQGFNEVGAPIGRQVGLLKGQLAALLLLTASPSPPQSTTAAAATVAAPAARKLGRNRAANNSASGSSSLPLLSSPGLEEARVALRRLARELDQVSLATLAEPDYEAMEHEKEHQDGGDAGHVRRETTEEKMDREQILDTFRQRLQTNGHRSSTSRRTLSLSSDDYSSSRDLLRLIAEKERRCFELREELSAEEASLKQLRTTWQRMATKELAYPASSFAATTSQPHHRRGEGSTASSTSDVATEAWNTLSSKIPGSLKMQLNNLLESIANVDTPPEPIEKSPLTASKPLAPPAADGNMLRPTYGGGLSVLEEEGSDVGSAALSPRSPRSPAVGLDTLAHSDSTSADNTTHRASLGTQHAQLASLAVEDSQALGFVVDSNGIAHPTASKLGLIDPAGTAPPTPPKPNAGRNNGWSRRTSMLGSLSNSFAASSSRSAVSPKGDETSTSTSSAFSMFAKRFKEARDNASDLLREAERKLGNAMTIDDFLGVASPAASAHTPSPSITLDGPSTDSGWDRSGRVADASWYAAAGGTSPRRSSERSPRLHPTTTIPTEAAASDPVARLSISSSRSSVGSPHLSPVIGGAPGAAGVFGMLMRSQSDLNKRASGDSWGWGGDGADDDDQQEADEDDWDPPSAAATAATQAAPRAKST